MEVLWPIIRQSYPETAVLLYVHWATHSLDAERWCV